MDGQETLGSHYGCSCYEPFMIRVARTIDTSDNGIVFNCTSLLLMSLETLNIPVLGHLKILPADVFLWTAVLIVG